MEFADDVGALKFRVGQFVDKKGNAAADPGVAEFASSNEAVATVASDTGDESGDTAVVTITGELGQAQITAKYNGGAENADNGGFTVTGDLNIVAGAAISATGTFEPNVV